MAQDYCENTDLYKVRYALLTLFVFAPLFWAFVAVKNFYPIPAWSLFSESVDLSEGRDYFVLRGETVVGDEVDLRPINITDGLRGRIHTMVGYVVSNTSYEIESPHPENVRQLTIAGGFDNLPRAARVKDLLRSWGNSYNVKFTNDSAERLRAIRLDEYRWPGGRYDDYREYVGDWRVEL